jgi:hemerythrin-like metal-binding protein
MARSKRSDRFFKALPFIYMVTGLGAMLALRNGLAILSGLILIAVGGIELLRRARFQRERELSESRLNSRMHSRQDSRMSRSLGGDSTQSLVKLSWRKSFECGHPVIDAQHRKLFDIGDGLINAAVKDKSRNHIEFLLDEMIEHIQEHFDTEEAVLARTRYPLSAEHQTHHAELLIRAQSLRDAYRSHQIGLSELVGFITYEVIVEHIIKEDLKFALKERQPVAA